MKPAVRFCHFAILLPLPVLVPANQAPLTPRRITIADLLKRYLAWYNHYVKGDTAPASLPPDTSKLDPEQTK